MLTNCYRQKWDRGPVEPQVCQRSRSVGVERHYFQHGFERPGPELRRAARGEAIQHDHGERQFADSPSTVLVLVSSLLLPHLVRLALLCLAQVISVQAQLLENRLQGWIECAIGFILPLHEYSSLGIGPQAG